ncbi:UNVERIFIED_CONTAM: hypothetical protein Sindi_1845500 [Sesamum indicum]
METDKVAVFLLGGQWCWPSITDTHYRSCILFHPSMEGLIISFDGQEIQLTIAMMIRSLWGEGPKVGWSSLLMGRFKTPKHAFVLWLAILGRLSTMDKPWLSHINSSYVLYSDGANDTHDHLFFRCTYSRGCLTVIRHTLQFDWANRVWATDVVWAARRWRGKHYVSTAYRTLLASCVNHIWLERNIRRFDGVHRDTRTVGALMVQDVHQRIFSVKLPTAIRICAFYRLWRIP